MKSGTKYYDLKKIKYVSLIKPFLIISIIINGIICKGQTNGQKQADSVTKTSSSALLNPSTTESPTSKPLTKEGFDPFLPTESNRQGMLSWDYAYVSNDKMLPYNLTINGGNNIQRADADFHGNDGTGAIITSDLDKKVYRTSDNGLTLNEMKGYSVSNDDYLISPDGKRQKLSNSRAEFAASEYERTTGKKYVPEKTTTVASNTHPAASKSTEVYGKAVIKGSEMKFENSTDTNTYRVKPYPGLANTWLAESKASGPKGIKKYFLVQINSDDNSVKYKQEIPAAGASILFKQDSPQK